MNEEIVENSVYNDDVNTDKDNSSFDSIVVSEELESVTSSDTSSIVSYKSDFRERVRIVHCSIIVFVIFFIALFSVVKIQERDSKHIDIPNTSEFDNELSVILEENMITPEENDTSIKYVLKGKEHLINFKFEKKLDSLGPYSYLSYDAKIYLDGNKVQSKEFEFDGYLKAYYGSLLSKANVDSVLDDTSLVPDDKNVSEYQEVDTKDTFVHYDKVLKDENDNEYFVLFFKSVLNDASYAFLLIFNEDNQLIYYSKEKGPNYIEIDGNQLLYGDNGYIKFYENAIGVIIKEENKVIEKHLTINNGTINICEGEDYIK